MASRVNERPIDLADMEFDDEYDSDPDDPTVASYDVYLKPSIADGRKVYVLQFPNREADQPYTAANGACPGELRIKPESGMVELDVPIDAHHNYDQSKGVKWGGAMKKSEAVKGVGMYGLPAGFNIGGVQGKVKGLSEEEQEDAIRRATDNWDRAVRDSDALVKQTLGGQIGQHQAHSPQYMIGTFRGEQLHLTPVNAMVQMRPQFHHLDALAEQDKARKAGAAAAFPRPTEAKAVHMTIKHPVDGEEDSQHSMAERIAATQKEHWQRHRYIDENHQKAWDGYHHLFVGKGKDSEEDLKKLPILRSAWTDEEYLDEISAPLDAARLSRSKVAMKNQRGKTKANSNGFKEAVEESSDESDTEGKDSKDSFAPLGQINDDLYDA